MNQNEYEGLLMMRPESRIAINTSLAETLEAIYAEDGICETVTNIFFKVEDDIDVFFPKLSKNPREKKTKDYRHRAWKRNYARHGKHHRICNDGCGCNWCWMNMVRDRRDGDIGESGWGIKPPKMNNNIRKVINEEVAAYFNEE